MMPRWLFALLLLSPIPAMAQGDEAGEEPRFEEFCLDADEEEVAAYDRDNPGGDFFEREVFDCSYDWLHAEQHSGPILSALRLPKIRETDRKRGTGEETTILFRRSGNGRVVQVECIYRLENDFGSRLEPLGGEVRTFRDNHWVSDPPAYRKLALGRADCAYLHEMVESHDVHHVSQIAPVNTNMIVLEAGPSFTEFRNSDGDLYYWYRYPAHRVEDEKKALAEELIRDFLDYLSERAMEDGARLRVARSLQ